ncbi:hypothetical protein [Dactylosporangium sp. NPDC048998]|uniref:hypothetical protein n=1 Tax=Dactylosporangium sp. NPDC048998 TaxID=3363976 RepID=UPI003721A46C
MGVRLQVLGVVLLGMLVSGGAGLLMHRVERDGAAQALDRRTAAAQDAVASAAQRYVDALQLVAGALEALPALEATSFATVTQPLGQLWLPGAVSVDYVVAVPDSGVADAQAAWRGRGLLGLILTAAPGGRRALLRRARARPGHRGHRAAVRARPTLAGSPPAAPAGSPSPGPR